MTELRITATLRKIAPKGVYDRRGVLLHDLDTDDKFGCFDLARDKQIERALDDGCSSARKELDLQMKAMNVQPVDKIEISSGIHGGKDGEIEFWYQRNYSKKIA